MVFEAVQVGLPAAHSVYAPMTQLDLKCRHSEVIGHDQCKIGTFTSLTIEFTTLAGVAFLNRLSGFNINRWASTGIVIRFTSSGST